MVKNLLVNDFIFSADTAEDGKLRYTTAQILDKRIYNETVTLKIKDSIKPESEPIMLVLPATTKVICAYALGKTMLVYFFIGTIIASLIWSFVLAWSNDFWHIF